MVASNGLGTYGDGAGVVTPTAHKLAHLGLVSKTGAGSNTVRPGLFFDGVTTIVTGAANMSYDVAPFTAVSSRGGSAGAVFFANDGVVNVATTAAPGTDSRIDVVYVWQREFSLDGGTTGPVVGVVQGAVAASPVAPSLAAFPGAVELARVTVPAGVTATNSGATITQTAPFTALEGAVLPVRTSSSLPASAKLGDQAYALDSGVSYEWSGSAWTLRQAGLRQVVTFTSSGSFSKAAYPWLRAVRVKVQAGGGAGGGATATAAGQVSVGSGGAGGGYAESFITNIASLASTETVTVGAGGTGASGGSGNTGGSSSFGSLVVATGGSGGSAAPAGANPIYREGLNGGIGTAGDIQLPGEAGAPAITSTVDANGGTGGSSVLGSGGRPQGTVSGVRAGTTGLPGRGFGGGGGGTGNLASASAQAGGAGAPGIVIVEMFG